MSMWAEVSLGGKYLGPLSHLTGPLGIFCFVLFSNINVFVFRLLPNDSEYVVACKMALASDILHLLITKFLI